MRFEIYQEKPGLMQSTLALPTDWRWRLRARNGRIVADGSEGYATKAGVKKAIRRICSEFGFSWKQLQENIVEVES